MTNLQLIQAVRWNCSPWTEGFRTRGLREDNPRSKKNQSGTLLTTSSWHPCTLTFLGSCEKTACENDSRYLYLLTGPGRGWKMSWQAAKLQEPSRSTKRVEESHMRLDEDSYVFALEIYRRSSASEGMEE